MRQGKIVDATLISAPSYTKNKAGKRDLEIHQTKKGNQWFNRIKIHIGVDKNLGPIHSVVTATVPCQSNALEPTHLLLESAGRSVDQPANRGAKTDSGTTVNSGRLNGSPGVTTFLKVTGAGLRAADSPSVLGEHWGAMHGLG
jgi:hypothetical protein